MFPIGASKKIYLINYLVHVILNFIPDNDEKKNSGQFFPIKILKIYQKLLRGGGGIRSHECNLNHVKNNIFGKYLRKTFLFYKL